jgi:hypothetical protein
VRARFLFSFYHKKKGVSFFSLGTKKMPKTLNISHGFKIPLRGEENAQKLQNHDERHGG